MTLTPLRLIVTEENPPAEDDQSASPVTMMTENEAITRRVPDSARIATADVLPDTPPDKPKRFPGLETLLPAGAVAVVLIGVTVALVMKGKSPAPPVPVRATGTLVPSTVEPTQAQRSAAALAPAAAMFPRIKPVPEIIRLGITAEPMETELSLDGNVIANHRLNLEVPRDRGIHVVSASAPGYVPFNQQVSFSSDVVLKISLRRAHTSPVRQVARPRPSQIEASPKNNVRPAAVSPHPGLQPGMNLDGPSLRPNAKPIDERNPYKP